jgi:hypothetical protein
MEIKCEHIFIYIIHLLLFLIPHIHSMHNNNQKNHVDLITAILHKETKNALNILEKNTKLAYQTCFFNFTDQTFQPSREFHGKLNAIHAALLVYNPPILSYIFSQQKPTSTELHNLLYKVAAMSDISYISTKYVERDSFYTEACLSSLYLIEKYNAPVYLPSDEKNFEESLFNIHVSRPIRMYQGSFPTFPSSLCKQVITCLLATAKKNLNPEHYINFTRIRYHPLWPPRNFVLISSPYEMLIGVYRVGVSDNDKKEPMNELLFSLFKLFLTSIPFDASTKLQYYKKSLPGLAAWDEYYTNHLTWHGCKHLFSDDTYYDLKI